MFLRSILVVLCLLVASCFAQSFELSAVASASLVRYSKGAPMPSGPLLLSSEQLSALTAWFASHSSGWSRSYVTYAPSIQVVLRHSDGQQSSLQVLTSKLVIYGAFGQQERKLTAEEHDSLLRLLGVSAG